MIYANFLVFGLSTLSFALPNLMSASLLVLPSFRKFHRHFFPAVFSPLLRMIRNERVETQARPKATFKKPPHANLNSVQPDTSAG